MRWPWLQSYNFLGSEAVLPLRPLLQRIRMALLGSLKSTFSDNLLFWSV